MVKFLSNFDTSAPTKNYSEAVQEFGFDKVVFLRRHALYFIIHTLVPAFSALAFLLTIAFFIFYENISTPNTILLFLLRGGEFFGAFFCLFLLYKSRINYFNYTLDYTIITPGYISSYNQTGIFARQIKTIEPEKIKTITFGSMGFINSLFNFGEVNILLEGEDLGKGEIRIDYIYKPEEVKEKILRLTDLEREKKNNIHN